MFSHSTTKVSSDHVNRIVNSILNKKQRKVVEQQQTFLRRNTDENQKRNNYLVEKFTKMKTDKDDEDEDFVSTRRKVQPMAENSQTAVVVQDENEETLCPICNENLSKFVLLKDREEHVDRCLKKSVEKKVPKIVPTANHKCQICGTSFHAKHLYLAHLKKCSSKNSVQLKHVIQFATKTPTEEAKPTKAPTIKNRVIKMEMPRTADDEQQQLAVALSASLKPDDELPNAFELLQQAAAGTTKKRKIIDLTKTALWNVLPEDKVKISATRLSALCERVIGSTSSENSYRFPPSFLQRASEKEFGRVEWWKITSTDPQDDEIPMTQLARILNDDDDDE